MAKAMTRQKALELLARQKEQARLGRARAQYQSALAKFRARKSDRGTVQFIGVHGQRDAKAKGRKGYLVYVTRTGKKKPVLDFTGPRQPKSAPSPKRFRNLNLDALHARPRAQKRFLEAHSKTFATGKAFVQGGLKKTGKEKSGLSFGPESRLVKRLTGDIKKSLESRAARRVFVVSMKAVVSSKGEQHVVESSAKIERADFAVVKRAGVKPFVQRKLYAFMAQGLANLGLVTLGSAAHVRNLKENRGKNRSKWTLGGQPWRGRKFQDVKLDALEYRIDEVTV